MLFNFWKWGIIFFLHGQFQSDYGVVPSWLQSPGFPVFTGIFSLFLPMKQAGIISTELAFLVVLIILGILLRKIFDSNYALFGITVFSILPINLYINGRILTESLFLVFNLSVFTLLLYKIFGYLENNYKSILIISVLTILLFFTRVEGILYVILLLILIPLLFDFRKTFLYLFLVIVAFSLYGYYSLTTCGSFNPIPKISYNVRLGTAVRNYVNDDKSSKSIDDLQRISWYALDENSNDLYRNKIMDNQYYDSLKSVTPAHPFSISDIKILNNLRETAAFFFQNNEFPIVFSILVVAGAFFSWYDNRKILALILLWILPSLYFLISHIEVRFLYIFIPYFIILIIFSVRRLAKMFNFNIVSSVIILLIILNSINPYYEYYKIQKENSVYYDLGKEMKNSLPKNFKFCIGIPHIAFWGEFKYIKLPIVKKEEHLIKYLNKNQVSYILLGDEVYSRKSYLELYEQENDSCFMLDRSFIVKNKIFKLFKIRTL